MPTVIQKFQYSGTLEQVTIPAGTTTIDMYLWGGAGAGGGSDAGGTGGSGTAGHYVAKTSYLVTAIVSCLVSIGVVIYGVLFSKKVKV